MTNIAELVDRGVVRIDGAESRNFLQGLVTCDMDGVEPGNPAFGALLTPQGKILFDFFVYVEGDSFLLDCRADMAESFAERLTFYKLRAKIDIADVSASYAVVAAWNGEASDLLETLDRDPRHPDLGLRGILSLAAPETTETVTAAKTSLEAYHTHRMTCGVPEGGRDFEFGNAFPHEAGMDQLHGVSFSKGCYVGQEVVSRMENRGTARTRMIIAKNDSGLPQGTTKILAGEKAIGTLGPALDGHAIATVRIDRLDQARRDGKTITAEGTPVELTIPSWADFSATGEESS